MPTTYEMNCETGETTVRGMTPEEEAAHRAIQEAGQTQHDAAENARQAREDQRAADLAALKAHAEAQAAADPASPWASLARLVGAL